MTSREQFELEHFGISPGKIGQKHYAAQPYPPSHWRRSLKGWVLLALGWVGGSLFTVAVIILWKVWP